MKILLIASECAPFAKTGGLADVIGALPKALARRGHDVRVVMPLYAGMPWDELEALDGVLTVPAHYGMAYAAIRVAHLPRSRVPVYFLEHHRYFDRPYLYGPPDGEYADNLERFTFLSRGALEVCKRLGWIPDVVHANDWQTALAPVYLNTVEWAQPLHGSASVFSIHNLAHQGVFGGDALFVTGLGREHYNAGEFEHFGTLNLTKAALYHATMPSTVSPTYAREIQTSAYGFGLDGVLASRGADLVGILNGIDTDVWNPATDGAIAARYDVGDVTGKAACKRALQEEAGLPARHEAPVFAFIGRLSSQKGVDVLAHALARALAWDLQMVVLGTGDTTIERHLTRLAAEHPDRCAAWLGFDEARAHRIEAGADFFVMPSRFEPCGLSQLYSLRYGTLPIVRATGGLVDTVESYDEATGTGTGFLFHDLTADALTDTIGWALSTWWDRPHHVTALRRGAMARDFSWDRAARAYEAVYRRAVARRRGLTA